MTIILHLITHLKLWINHVIPVTPPAPLIVTLSAPDDPPLQLDPTSLSSHLQDTSSIEIEFVSEFEGHLNHANLLLFLNNMTMNCSY